MGHRRRDRRVDDIPPTFREMGPPECRSIPWLKGMRWGSIPHSLATPPFVQEKPYSGAHPPQKAYRTTVAKATRGRNGVFRTCSTRPSESRPWDEAKRFSTTRKTAGLPLTPVGTGSRLPPGCQSPGALGGSDLENGHHIYEQQHVVPLRSEKSAEASTETAACSGC